MCRRYVLHVDVPDGTDAAGWCLLLVALRGLCQVRVDRGIKFRGCHSGTISKVDIIGSHDASLTTWQHEEVMKSNENSTPAINASGKIIVIFIWVLVLCKFGNHR